MYYTVKKSEAGSTLFQNSIHKLQKLSFVFCDLFNQEYPYVDLLYFLQMPEPKKPPNLQKIFC